MKYLLILVLIIEIALTCLIPSSKGFFFNKLELYSSGAWLGLAYYIGVLFALDVIQNLKPLMITLYTNIRRRLMTQEIIGKGLDNPTRHQRIQEDIKLYTVNQTSVYSEYFISFAIVAFLMIQNIQYPLLLIASIIYSIVCIGSAYLFKPAMIRVEKQIQQVETEFRERLRIETVWEQISTFVTKVITTNVKNAVINFNYGLTVKLQTGIMTLLPYAYLLPSYLNRQITLGVMMEQAAIFQLLVINLMIVVSVFSKLMQAHASKERIDELK